MNLGVVLAVVAVTIALLVWGTHIVRTGMLRVFGENLRGVLAKSFGSRPAALLAGLGVTSLVQSATATATSTDDTRPGLNVGSTPADAT